QLVTGDAPLETVVSLVCTAAVSHARHDQTPVAIGWTCRSGMTSTALTCRLDPRTAGARLDACICAVQLPRTDCLPARTLTCISKTAGETALPCGKDHNDERQRQWITGTSW